MQEFSLYPVAVRYFTQLRNLNPEHQELNLLLEYEEIKKQSGEFIAAMFIRDVYNAWIEDYKNFTANNVVG